METVNWFTMIGAMGTFVAAGWGVYQYRKAANLERAKWCLGLYEKFYEKQDLKSIRDTMDCDADSSEVVSIVLKCPPEFSDYLNFFEFMAFLKEKGQLREDEIKALFDYYIKCLNRHQRVVTFIEENGYENLSNLLAKWK